MPPSPVGTHIPQTPDIVDQGAAQVVLDLEGGEMRVEVEELLAVELADGGTLVDVEAAHELLRYIGADAIEGLERFFDEVRFGEVESQDEHHCDGRRQTVDEARGRWLRRRVARCSKCARPETISRIAASRGIGF